MPDQPGRRSSGNKDGFIEAVRCIKMELGEPDASGRRSPVLIAGLGIRAADADGRSSRSGPRPTPWSSRPRPTSKTNRKGYIAADPETLRTSKQGVFAGGDIVTGGATVILAMGAGRKAAASIHEYLTTGEWDGPVQ